MGCDLRKGNDWPIVWHLSNELLKGSAVDVFEWLNIININALVNLMAGSVDRTKFHYLFANLSDKASIAGAAGSG